MKLGCPLGHPVTKKKGLHMSEEVTTMKAEKREVEVLDALELPDIGCAEDFEKEVPKDRKTCLAMLKAGASDLYLTGAARLWHIGRIISTLQDRKEKNIFEDAAKATRYSERHLQYVVAVHKKFPNLPLVLEASKVGVEWSDLKMMSGITDDQKRKNLLKQLISGAVKKEDLKDKVDEVKPPRKAQDPLDAPDKINPAKIALRAKNKLDKDQEKFLTIIGPQVMDTVAVIMMSEDEKVKLSDDELEVAHENVQLLVESGEYAIINIQNMLDAAKKILEQFEIVKDVKEAGG